MALDNEDLTHVREILLEVVEHSQEKLARMIAKEFLGVREELTRAKQERSDVRSSLSELKLDYEFLKRRLQNIEIGVAENRKEHIELAKRINYVEGELDQIQQELKGIVEHIEIREELEAVERRVEKLETTVY